MTTSAIWEHTLAHHLWNQFQTWWHFKVTLPGIQRTVLETVQLNVANLPPILKNNIIEGRYEVQERKLATRFLNADDKVLEFGSAIGFIGLFCQQQIGVRHYTGIEANPHTIRLAEENYAMNGIVPRIKHAAVAPKDGTIMLNMHPDFWRDSVVANDVDAHATQVPARTLGTIVKELDFEPTVLIADIEGAEQYVRWTELPKTVRTVIMELHPEVIGYPETYKVVADLMNLGFVVAAEEGGTYAFTRL
jgi:FkbM family methyltransferase